jgi:hypothetical protein
LRGHAGSSGKRRSPHPSEDAQGEAEAALLLPGASGARGIVRRLNQIELVGLACFAVAVGLFAWSVIGFFYRIPIYVMLRDWCMDDTFYYLQVARNVSSGRGVTFDGVDPTNGFHWLWMLMCVPMHWLASWPEGTTRLMKVFEVLAGIVTLGSLLWLARLMRSFWVLALPALFGLIYEGILYTGMEASVNVMSLMLCAPVAVWALGGDRPPTRLRILVLAGACILPGLARVENFAFVLMLPAVLAVWGWRKVPGFTGRTALWLIGPVLAGTAVYFAANWLAFDTPLPVSGMVKQWWASLGPAGSVGLRAAPANFAKLAALPLPREGLIYGGIGLLVLAASWLVPSYRRQGDRRQHLLDAFCLCAVLLHLVKLTAYSVCSTPALTFYTWYHVAALVVKWFVLFYVPTRVLYAVRHVRLGLRAAPSWLPVASYAIVYAVAGAANWSLYDRAAMTIDYCRQLADYRGAEWEIASYVGSQWANENLPPDAVIGVWDSGVLGYFCKARVINLDGLINSRDFLERVKKGELEQFLADHHVNYLANVVPCKMTDAGDYFGKKGRLPGRMKGQVRLVYKEERLRISWGERDASFRVYRYDPPTDASAGRAPERGRQSSAAGPGPARAANDRPANP